LEKSLEILPRSQIYKSTTQEWFPSRMQLQNKEPSLSILSFENHYFSAIDLKEKESTVTFFQLPNSELKSVLNTQQTANSCFC